MKLYNPLLKQLLLKARTNVYHTHLGEHLSHAYGEGYEFAELREYHLGDDIRHINWNITAKLQRPYVKVIHTHKQLLVNVVGFLDGSLFFGVDNLKQRLLCDIAAHLGYATYQRGDVFSGFGFTHANDYMTTPTKEVYTLEHFIEQLHETNLLHTELHTAQKVQKLTTLLTQPSLLIVISDFLNLIDLAPLTLKHDVVAIVIRHTDEETLKPLGEISLQSPVNKGKTHRNYLNKKSTIHYQKKLATHDKELYRNFRKQGIRFTKITTTDNIIVKLLELFR